MLAAFKAFGQLAAVSTVEQARRFLEIGWELVPRQPNTYHFTDEDHVHALIGIARAHPELRAEAFDQLLQALLVDQRMAELLLRHGRDLLRDDSIRTVAAVKEAAAGGSQYAALALVAAEADTSQAEPLARQRLEAALAPRVHQPGVHSLRHWPWADSRPRDGTSGGRSGQVRPWHARLRQRPLRRWRRTGARRWSH